MALLRIGLQAPVDEDVALQPGLVRALGAADAATLRRGYDRLPWLGMNVAGRSVAGPRYEVSFATSLRASSMGTSTGDGSSPGSFAGTSSVGRSASAWWESRPQ
jgi:hypothetical protein